MSNPATRDGNASARVADALRASILSGELAPGMRIRQEELAEQLGASRIPVREALRSLEVEGLITLVANTGAWVARLSLAECDETYRIRERIEPLLLGFALPGHSEKTLDQLAHLSERMESNDDVEEFLQMDREFHLLTYAPAHTSLLSDIVHRLWNTTQHYRRAYTLLLDGHRQRIVHDEHHMIVTALRDGDAEGAGGVLEGHIRRTRLQLGRHPEVFESS